jgi:hypothetical protein
MLIIIVFNSTIVMCIVITLDSPITSLGVTHSCHSCFVALFNIILLNFLTSLNIITLVFVPWFFDKRLFEFVVVTTFSNEKLVGYGFHLFQHFLVKAFYDMTFKFIYLSSLCFYKLFISDVNNSIYTMKKQNHEN